MDLQQEIEQLRRENEGLKRIMRERANKDREIRPKDQPGFVVLRASQELSFPPNARQFKKLYWRAIVQCPYPAELTYTEVAAIWANGGKDQLEAALDVKLVPWDAKAEVLWDLDTSSAYWNVKIRSEEYPVKD